MKVETKVRRAAPGVTLSPSSGPCCALQGREPGALRARWPGPEGVLEPAGAGHATWEGPFWCFDLGCQVGKGGFCPLSRGLLVSRLHPSGPGG